MLADYSGLASGAMLWALLCALYGILLFFVPFILWAIMRNTRRTAELLAQIKASQSPALPTPVSTPLPLPVSTPLPPNEPASASANVLSRKFKKVPWN